MIFIPFSLFIVLALLSIWPSGWKNECFSKNKETEIYRAAWFIEHILPGFTLASWQAACDFPHTVTPLPACAAILEHLVSSLLSLKAYLAQPIADLIVTEDFTATLVLRRENTVYLQEVKDSAKILYNIKNLHWA